MDTYGRRLIVDRPFAATLALLTRAVRDEGLEVIGRVDVRDVISRSIGREVRQYDLLQIAAPQVLFEVLREDLGSATVLPASVAVFELADGETAVIVSEPFAPLLADPAWRSAAPHVATIADHECERLARSLDRLAHAVTTTGGRVSAATCRWAKPTMLVDAPLCYEAEAFPWTCVREETPRLLETTESCERCVRWEPRPAAESSP